ncbi:HAD superfamily hydrolase (TIGR01509 family) [Azonexus fungiphilus]|uniref:HAD superfamily hydrolase (TIGR01509 family) n=1 Tax=Azonexus fungiphilus TaxID=146940 RepID=A0A495WKS1_9RHOO|nr:HAD family hydrolase [Azonexus fungiphilus]RKT62342.1 HAD superfamily hydrolase (TIGR01509 family) [Azonexus fungiphilus]
MATLQALIFDVDGTLAETERDGHRPAFNAAFRDCGLAWHWDEQRYGALLAITGGKERIRHYATHYAPAIAARPDFDALVGQLHRIKTAHYLRLADQGQLPLRPGIARLIGEARQAGLRLAIATTTTPENVDALLRANLGPDAPGWFDVIGAGDIVPAKKPAPDIYQWVLDRLALPPSACLAIEDSEIGLKSALAAGLRCVVTVSEYTRGQDFRGAWQVLQGLAGSSLAELGLRSSAGDCD